MRKKTAIGTTIGALINALEVCVNMDDKRRKTLKELSDKVANIEVCEPKPSASESTAICCMGKYARRKWVYVNIDFHSTGYRLSAIGQEFFMNIVGSKATKASIQEFFNCMDSKRGVCFSELEFADKDDALFAFEMIQFIPKVPSFLMSES